MRKAKNVPEVIKNLSNVMLDSIMIFLENGRRLGMFPLQADEFRWETTRQIVQ
jgi:hypothetical protein